MEEWTRHSDAFNELYYKNIIAILIMFKFLEKVIPKQSWYESGYRANIIVYSIAFLNFKINEQFPGRILDRNEIWLNQRMDDTLEMLLIQIAKYIFDFITNEKRPVMNVTEWCKRTECWEKCKKLPFDLDSDIVKILAWTDNIAADERAGRRERKMENGIESQLEVVKKGSHFWKNVALFAVQKKILTEKEMGILQTAVAMDSGRMPSDKQSAVILQILEKVRDEGFTD